MLRSPIYRGDRFRLMNILLVAHKYPPYALGGVEVYTHHLAAALKAHHRVSVFFRHDEAGGPSFAEHDARVEGVRVRRVSLRPAGSVAGEFLGTFLNREIEASFACFVDQAQPDLIHVQHVMALSARLLHLARRSGVPVVLTLHDYWFLCGNSQLIWPDARTCTGKAWGTNCVRCAAAARFPVSWVRFLRPALAPLFVYRDRMVRQAALQADRFLAPSQFLIERYVESGFPRDRFTFLENGIPTEPIRRIPRRPADGPLRVTFLGSLAWQKGVHVLAEAFSGLPAGAARLRIWGDPAVFPAYATRVQSLLDHPDARLMGRIPNERVGEVLADSDVMVIPSLWYENSPVVIQEARAAGVPVIASRHGALAEKVRDGVDGLLFPPGDVSALRQVLQRLVAEPGLLSHLRQNIPPPMAMDEHVRRLEAIYDEVIADGKRRKP
jgi:glycosyltransferase involved in cell wall biosynthesis